MGFFTGFDRKKENDAPLIAQVKLGEHQKQRRAQIGKQKTSLLASLGVPNRMIRLVYVAFGKFSSYDSKETKVGQTIGISSPLRLPDRMSLRDAYEVVSYVSSKIERENNLQPASEESVALTDKVLCKYFGFEKVEGKPHGYFHLVSKYDFFHKMKVELPEIEKIDGVIDLFTVGGDFKLFKRSSLYDRYFEWFSEKVDVRDVQATYEYICREDLVEGIESKKFVQKNENDNAKTM